MNRVTLLALSWCLAIPGLSSAAEKRPVDNGAAQKGTIAEMRDIGTAMMAWLVEQISEAPPTGAPALAADDAQQPIDWPSCPRASFKELQAVLVPQYIKILPERDPWGNPYEFCLDRKDTLRNKNVIGIRSSGRDGVFEGTSYLTGPFDPEDFDRDLVWLDGYFARWPQKPPSA